MRVHDVVDCAVCRKKTTVPPEHLQYRVNGGIGCLDCYRKAHKALLMRAKA